MGYGLQLSRLKVSNIFLLPTPNIYGIYIIFFDTDQVWSFSDIFKKWRKLSESLFMFSKLAVSKMTIIFQVSGFVYAGMAIYGPFKGLEPTVLP